MQEKGILTEHEILQISRQVLDAVGEAHAHHIIHRDLKPHNIMLDHRGNVVIMDFGIAKAAFYSDLTVTGAFVGTAKYASPEQAKGIKVTPSSDLYSWGVVMYEMATGQAPFTGNDVASLIYQHLDAPVIAPAQLNPDLSPELNGIILTCLEKDPGDRYQSAADMLAQMDQLTANVEVADPTPSDPTTEGRGGGTHIFNTALTVKAGAKRSDRRRGDWILVGSLSLLLATVLGWWFIHKNSIQTPLPLQQIETNNMSHIPSATDEPMFEVWTEKNKYRIGESIKIKFRMRDNAYLFLYHEDAQGQGQVIFPMKMDQNNFLRGGLTYTLPGPNASFDFIVQPPTGTEHIKALYTSSPDQADRWRKMAKRDLLNELKKQKDVLAFDVVN
jgi:serine/threonine protein kinase